MLYVGNDIRVKFEKIWCDYSDLLFKYMVNVNIKSLHAGSCKLDLVLFLDRKIVFHNYWH